MAERNQMTVEVKSSETQWQFRPSDLHNEIWDVAIVGAGPAGSTAAIRLAERGHRVILLEKRRFPREKVCGDGLLPDALRHLAALGLENDIRARGCAIGLLKILSPGGIEFDVPGEFISLERSILDTLIARRAADVGAVVCQADVCRVTQPEPNRVELAVQGQTVPIKARYAIIATGAQVNLARRLSLINQPDPSALAMRCYVQSPVELRYPILSYDKAIRPGYAWIFPLGGGKYNVGCGMVLHGKTPHGGALLRDVYKKFVESVPVAGEIVARGTQVTPLKGAALRCGLPKDDAAVYGTVLSIGETIGTTLPFTGEGIGNALRSAFLASHVLDSTINGESHDGLARYSRLLDSEIRPAFDGYQAAQRWLGVNWINDLMAWRIRNSPYLRQTCRQIILGTASPRAVYSVRAIIKSIWR